jgi:hypothetical protein
MTIEQEINGLLWYDLVGKLKKLLLKILYPPLPVYADNASAILGGLSVGRQYKTATGEVRIVV